MPYLWIPQSLSWYNFSSTELNLGAVIYKSRYHKPTKSQYNQLQLTWMFHFNSHLDRHKYHHSVTGKSGRERREERQPYSQFPAIQGCVLTRKSSLLLPGCWYSVHTRQTKVLFSRLTVNPWCEIETTEFLLCIKFILLQRDPKLTFWFICKWLVSWKKNYWPKYFLTCHYTP